MKPNPKVSRLPAGMPSILRVHGTAIRGVGAALGKKPLGCGKYGCTFPGRVKGAVVKVTRDRHEVSLVRSIRKIRRGPVRRPSSSQSMILHHLGVTPEWVRSCPGFILFPHAPRKIGANWVYSRESVTPIIDWRYSKDPLKRSVYEDTRKAMFWIEDYDPDPMLVIARHRRLAVILKTLAGLKALYDIEVQDVHEEQVGMSLRATRNRPKGTLVLYDGDLL